MTVHSGEECQLKKLCLSPVLTFFRFLMAIAETNQSSLCYGFRESGTFSRLSGTLRRADVH